MHSMKKASEAEVDKTTPRTSDPTIPIHSDAQPMDTDIYGPPLPPRFSQSIQSDHAFKHSDLESDHSDPHSEDHSEQPKRVCFKAKNHSDEKKHKVRAKYYSLSSSSEEDQSSVPSKSLLNLNRLLLSLNINRIAQTQFSTGR